jgi:dTDP-4-dehydrorhamnose reductase
MKWLIFGSTGQLGQTLVDQLRNLHEVIPVSKKNVDITKIDEVDHIISKHRPDQIVNAAAWTNVIEAENNKELAWAVNVDGAVNIAKSASKYKVPLTHISTDYVFDGNFSSPIGENEPQCPVNFYGETKAQAEIEIRNNYSDLVLIIRTSWLYGLYGHNFPKSILKKAVSRPSDLIKVVDDQFGQPTSANELSTKIQELGEKRVTSGIIHGTTAGQTSWFNFATYLLDYADLNSKILIPIKSDELESNVVRPKYSVLGHQNWSAIDVTPLGDWRAALKELAPRLKREVEKSIAI